MKKKLFVVSDIHGHLTLLKKALDEAGFDENDPDHLFVGCGDYFDRGYENTAVYDYLTALPHKVLVRGNHEDLMLDALDRGRILYHDIHNGTDLTIEEFFGCDSITSEGHLAIKRESEKRLRKFIDSTVDYFETENFVFIHGWIPLDSDYKIREWRLATPADWEDARFFEWMSMYRAGRTLPDKTIVCGHRSTSCAHIFDMRRSPTDSKPFYGERMIAIDALTVRSGRVNVLVLEDELLPETEHSMTLFGDQFDEVVSGRKQIEMRICDSKRRSVKVGDTIVFSRSTDKKDTVKVRVCGTYRYEDFRELVHGFKPRSLGFSGKSKSSIAGKMKRLYGDTRIRKFGAFAIKIRLIDGEV